MRVTLSEADHAQVAEKAAAMGISVAEYIRRLVRRDLEDRAVRSAPSVSELFGIGDSGANDVAAQERRYVGDAIADGKIAE